VKTYDAIERISKAIIDDDLCEAIVIKGSIGRGDDDEYSDVDMYAVVNETDRATFMTKSICLIITSIP
jgi:predicted nucleotidyltransferase